MSQDAYQQQQTLFADPLGLRLRHAREAKRWSVEAVAQQLKLPVAVVEAMEKEDWQRLGAPIYARSYLTGYLKLLGLPTVLAEEVLRPQPQAPLVAMGGVPAGKRMVDRSLVNLGYLAITAAIVGSVVMLAMRYQSPTRDPQVLALDSPAPAVAPAREAATPVAPKPAPASPVMASMAPALPPAAPAPVAPAPAAVTPGEILLRFRGESWIEIVGGDGKKVEQGLVGAGAERRLKPGEVTRVTLGNADAVEVLQGGRAVDVSAYRQASIARFGVSSEGVLTPPGG
jgi:cytoskeleton protein RodZ